MQYLSGFFKPLFIAPVRFVLFTLKLILELVNIWYPFFVILKNTFLDVSASLLVFAVETESVIVFAYGHFPILVQKDCIKDIFPDKGG